jgi:adenosylmethionine-8-amino-7-oxononanoate aminotransferase
LDLPPLHVEKAQGAYLNAKDGRKILDAASSWWGTSTGVRISASPRRLRREREN